MSGSRTSREVLRVVLACGFAALGSVPLSALDPARPIEQYIVTKWKSRDSFPGGVVHAIAQTPDGYLWIGAEYGLVRFDGVNFRLFDHSNTPSLPVGRVLEVTTDSEGVLWVRMESPYLFRYRGGSFEQAYPVKLNEPGVTAIARGNRGSILLAPADTALRYSAGRFTPIVSAGSEGGLAMSIAETADGTVWVGRRDTGLLRIHGGSGSEVPGLPDQKVNVLLSGAGAELWIGTDAGLVRWDGQRVTRTGVPEPLTRSQILALARDRDFNLWVATSAGIARVDPKGAIAQAIPFTNPRAVNAIFEDREGNMWFAGAEGLAQLRDAPFSTYPGVATGGGTLYVDDAGRTWVGPTTGGLLWIRGAERKHISDAGLDQDVIYSMSGGAGEIWIGRRRGGLTQLREADGAVYARTYTAADALAAGPIYTVHRSRDGTVWAGTLSGAVSRIQKGRITTFTTENGLSGEAVTAIEETPDGVLWVGTDGGLDAFRDGSWHRYGGEVGLPPGRVNSLEADPDGKLWIATSAGLFYWSGTRLENVRNIPGSLQGEILGLAADSAGSLWIATDRRVLRVSRASMSAQSETPPEAREFGTADGLPSTRGIRRDHSVTKDSLGRIWLSLQGGLCDVDPTRSTGVAPALVHLESVVVDGRPLAAGSGFRYPSSRQRVVFNFIGVSLAAPGRVLYRYRLAGYDDDWSQPTASREAAYTNLPPASYTFHVMASNSDGLWNGAAVGVALDVEPQLLQTWWFRVSALSASLIAIYLAFRYRMARVRAAMNRAFEERLAERTRIARELHDTLLQGFLSASMQVHVAADLLPSDSTSRPILTRALELMQQVIEEGRNTVRGLRSGASAAVPLETALSQIKDEMSADNEVNFRVVVDGRRRNLHPILQDEVYRIGREALINAFRHANARNIEVELSYARAGFRLFVRDDGAGISEEILQAGRDGHWGLVGMRERAERIGAQLHVFSRPSAGTEIELDVPSNVAFRASSRRL